MAVEQDMIFDHDLLSRAFELAAELHQDQTRKGTNVPYVSHLMSVSALVIEHGGTDIEAAAALFHDAVEDQGGPDTLAMIVDNFDEVIAGIVSEVSDTDQVPKPPWRARKEAYLSHLRNHASDSARLVSACDRLHNARCTLAELREKGSGMWDAVDADGVRLFNAGRDEQIWFLNAYLDASNEGLQRIGAKELRLELVRTVDSITTLALPGVNVHGRGGWLDQRGLVY